MKKILIFSLTYYPDNVSGSDGAIKEITDRIDSSDIEFHMVTLRFNSSLLKLEQYGKVLVHRIGIAKKNPTMEDYGKFPLNLNKPLYQFYAVLKACQLNRKYHYDAIWAMMAHSAGVPAAVFKMLYPKKGYVLTLQEGKTPEYIEKKLKIKTSIANPWSKIIYPLNLKKTLEELGPRFSVAVGAAMREN